MTGQHRIISKVQPFSFSSIDKMWKLEVLILISLHEFQLYIFKIEIASGIFKVRLAYEYSWGC